MLNEIPKHGSGTKATFDIPVFQRVLSRARQTPLTISLNSDIAFLSLPVEKPCMRIFVCR